MLVVGTPRLASVQHHIEKTIFKGRQAWRPYGSFENKRKPYETQTYFTCNFFGFSDRL